MKTTLIARTMVLFLTVNVGFPASSPAQQPIATPPASALADVVRRIENRRGNWIALKADLTLYFLAENGHTASCRAELAYQRLDERILLKCLNAKDEILFVFKTRDREFELYLPKQKTAYRGDIFTLEDSPNIESYLKPLDLYRALKPLVIPIPQAEIEYWDEGTVTLRVKGRRHEKSYLARRILATKAGDVRIETYYSYDEKPVTIIRRSKLKKIRLPDAEGEHIYFAHRLVIEKPAQRTTLLFDNVSFYPSLGEKELYFVLPPETRILNLN